MMIKIWFGARIDDSGEGCSETMMFTIAGADIPQRVRKRERERERESIQ